MCRYCTLQLLSTCPPNSKSNHPVTTTWGQNFRWLGTDKGRANNVIGGRVYP